MSARHRLPLWIKHAERDLVPRLRIQGPLRGGPRLRMPAIKQTATRNRTARFIDFLAEDG